jgi:hypothetical protein
VRRRLARLEQEEGDHVDDGAESTRAFPLSAHKKLKFYAPADSAALSRLSSFARLSRLGVEAGRGTVRRRLARLEQEEGDHVDDGADPRVDEEGVAGLLVTHDGRFDRRLGLSFPFLLSYLGNDHTQSVACAPAACASRARRRRSRR